MHDMRGSRQSAETQGSERVSRNPSESYHHCPAVATGRARYYRMATLLPVSAVLLLLLPHKASADMPVPPECRTAGGCRMTSKGWWPEACVHTLPKGAAARAASTGQGIVVTHASGAIDMIPVCAAPVPKASLARLQRRNWLPGSFSTAVLGIEDSSGMEHWFCSRSEGAAGSRASAAEPETGESVRREDQRSRVFVRNSNAVAPLNATGVLWNVSDETRIAVTSQQLGTDSITRKFGINPVAMSMNRSPVCGVAACM